MPKIRSLSIFLISLILVAISGCSAKPEPQIKVEPKAEIPIGAKYRLSEFEFDLVQTQSIPHILNKEQTKEVIQKTFNSILKNAGMLYEGDDEGGFPVTLKLDYYRPIIGFSSDKLGKPLFYYSIHTKVDGTAKKIITTDELRLDSIQLFDFSSKTNTKNDMSYTLSIGAIIARSLIDETPHSSTYVREGKTEKEIIKELTPHYLGLLLQERPIPEVDESYIPVSLTDKYYTMLTSLDRKVRLDGYDNIQGKWLNQPKLFDLVNQSILAHYDQPLDKDTEEELKEQIKTLAELGLIKYKETFLQVAKDASTSELRKYANEQMEVLEIQSFKSEAIHKPLPVSVTADWKQHQLYNMIRSQDLYLKTRAAKFVYRDYPQDELLLETLSAELDKSLINSYRASTREDFHAWICRALGLSGNTKYKGQLEYIAKHAKSKKVRNFAEEFADEL